MRKTVVAAAGALFATGMLAGAPASAQFAKPEDAIRYRKAAMTLMSAHAGRIGQVVRGDRPFNAAEVQANAAIVETLSKLPFDAYGPGTDQGGGTRAKAEIWQQGDKFRARAADMQKVASALSAAAKAGGLDAVKTAFGDLGKACNACHDDFRSR